jgi:hypothetical protein
MNAFSVTVFFLLSATCQLFGQSDVSLSVTLHGVSPYDTLTTEELRQLEHEFILNIPVATGALTATMGGAEGDTSLLVRTFPLSEHSNADGTYVAPADGGGWRLGLGHYIGIDSFHWSLMSADGSLLGSGQWQFDE